MRTFCRGLFAVCVALAVSSYASAQTFGVTDGTLTAKATFSFAAGKATITLQNLQATGVTSGTAVLTGLFFDLGAGATISKGVGSNAMVAVGSTLLNDPSIFVARNYQMKYPLAIKIGQVYRLKALRAIARSCE